MKNESKLNKLRRQMSRLESRLKCLRELDNQEILVDDKELKKTKLYSKEISPEAARWMEENRKRKQRRKLIKKLTQKLTKLSAEEALESRLVILESKLDQLLAVDGRTGKGAAKPKKEKARRKRPKDFQSKLIPRKIWNAQWGVKKGGILKDIHARLTALESHVGQSRVPDDQDMKSNKPRKICKIDLRRLSKKDRRRYDANRIEKSKLKAVA